ncbi:MAG: MCE family protein [Acidobacteria bacterium]|nr:MCE family protein [Acidobacteriota bacterium]
MPPPYKVARIRWAKVRVAVMALAGCSILFVVVYLLTPGLFRTSSPLRIYMDDSAGLLEGAPVRFNGVRVGKLKSIELSGSAEPERVVRAEIDVESRFLADIPVDSIAQIGVENLLGNALIDIDRGRSSARVAAGDEIRFMPAPEIEDRANMMRSIQRSMRGIGAVVRDIEAGRGSLGQFVRGDSLYDRANERLLAFQGFLRAASGRATPAGQLIYRDDLYRELQDRTAKLEQQMAGIEKSRILQDAAQHESLRKGIQEARNSIRKLERNPVFRSDAAYARTLRAVRSAARGLDGIASGQGTAGALLASSNLYDSLTGSNLRLAQFAREFRENPRKFLRVNLNLF